MLHARIAQAAAVAVLSLLGAVTVSAAAPQNASAHLLADGGAVTQPGATTNSMGWS
ncbi:hypothetical protein [Streptomyces sp. S1]|uniref:hypothetical protein n=1 Tax=Streptomyces sp. S1 TaxID=718288 RepID=UPI003D7040FF